MKRRLSNLALSALTVAAVSGLTVLRTGLAADAAWRQDYTPLTVNTYPVSESFTGISVTDYYADVQLRVSRDGTVSVVTRDAEDVAHTVRVEGGTLTISRPEPTVGQRLFHHEDDDPEVTVYLPAGNYGALTVNTTSGDTELSDSYIQSLKVLSVSGEVSLERTTAAGAVTIDTSSGDVELERADAASLAITTTSGEVEGSLLTAKNFAVSSTVGRISVPNADPAAGPCTVTTTSGDIRLAVRP